MSFLLNTKYISFWAEFSKVMVGRQKNARFGAYVNNLVFAFIFLEKAKCSHRMSFINPSYIQRTLQYLFPVVEQNMLLKEILEWEKKTHKYTFKFRL